MEETSETINKIDLIGIGSAKNGSTWLARCLEGHPSILFSGQKSHKELHFFNSRGGPDYLKTNFSNYHKGLEWYPNQFPKPQPGKIHGEFSISYLLDPKAPFRIKKHFPHAKILVTLRNPTQMAYSFYWWVRATVEQSVPPTFAETVKQELFLPRRIIRLGLMPLRFFKLHTPFLWSPIGGALYQIYKKINLRYRDYPSMDPQLKTQLTNLLPRWYREAGKLD